MLNIFSSILTNILTALYQPFWFALLAAILAMFSYLYMTDKDSAGEGFRKSIYNWKKYFLMSKEFRKLFFLCFYVFMILFRTLLNRNMWLNPLSDVMGGWWIYAIDSATRETKLTTECIENFILFMPFSALLMWRLGQTKRIRYILWTSIKTVFLFSISIEFLQLFLRVGTFQLSDIFYNTFGGFFGGLFYWIICRVDSRFS